MRTALIGHTGFVGSNLKEQYSFTDLYNSKNFKEMKDQKYDLVVCAGISAVKWMANKEPIKDLENIKALEEVLSTIDAKQFVLISTIDVYATTQILDEDFDCASISNHAYGTHRLEFEKFCNKRFDNCTIVRLPGLFGNGLKKNVIYDLLNDNCLEMINTDSSFQYYYLKHLSKDIQIAIDNDIKLINLFTEPLPTQLIFSTLFSDKEIGQEKVPQGHYDLHTKYASKWNNTGNYIYTKDEMMQQLTEFIKDYRSEK
ncbi:MAG: hypothetical protein JJV95_00980 [Sulfurospirillum sp.]|nr:hypothetical protein [Sulfurospirillum sp.]